MKKYILSYYWGYIESDTVLSDCTYYVEVKILDKHELGCLKRCSPGSKAERMHLGNIFRDNELKINENRKW